MIWEYANPVYIARWDVIDLYPNSVSNVSIIDNDMNNTTVFNIASIRLGVGNKVTGSQYC